MKRKLLTALVILVSFAFTACREDAAMDDLLIDTQSVVDDSAADPVNGNNGNGGSGGSGTGNDPDDDVPPGGN